MENDDLFHQLDENPADAHELFISFYIIEQ